MPRGTSPDAVRLPASMTHSEPALHGKAEAREALK